MPARILTRCRSLRKVSPSHTPSATSVKALDSLTKTTGSQPGESDWRRLVTSAVSGSRRGGLGAVRPLLRRMLGINPCVGRDDALRMAHQECDGMGWPWEGEVRVDEQLRVFRVWTSFGHRGGNAIVVIDLETGHVRRSSYGSRCRPLTVVGAGWRGSCSCSCQLLFRGTNASAKSWRWFRVLGVGQTRPLAESEIDPVRWTDVLASWHRVVRALVASC